MTAALVYRALERNTGQVGLASVLCTSIKAVNPEIAALQQHQDPASDGAAALNKKITLELAKQIASIGGDAQTALQSGTFAPGKIGDPTAAGNTCDDANDPIGCIFSQNLLVEDASAAEIDAAVAGVAGAGGADAGGAAAGNSSAAANVSCGAAPPAPPAPAADSGKADAANADAGAAASAAAAGAGGIDLGKCANAGIIFAANLDGRKENSFEPADLKTFNHGSALNIGVITDFIISRLKDKACGANAAAISAAEAAQTAAKAAQGQAAADAWNKALGVSA
jgi:hypothetical protein